MSDDEIFWGLFEGEQVPVEIARIPTRTLEVISGVLAKTADERAQDWASDYRRGYVEGQHDLVRVLVDVITREMAPLNEIYRKLMESEGQG